MIRRIARKERTDIVRDGRFRWSGAIVLSLLVVAVASGWQQHQSLDAEHEAAQRLARSQWVTQGPLRPHAAAHYGTWVFKPQMPLGFFDRGIGAYTGTAVFLQAHHQHDTQFRAAQDAPSVHRFADMTAGLVLQVMLPLLIVLVAFSTIAGEREHGTLRQIAALGVSPRDLMWGKVWGVTTALALLLVPAAVIGALAIALASDGAPTAFGASRVALLIATYLMYFAAFLGVTLTASALAPTARTALVALLAFWIVSVFVAPRAAADLARATHPTLSRFEFQHVMYRAIKAGLDGHNPEGERGAALERDVLARYGASSLTDLPVNYSGLALQAGEDSDAEVWDRFYGALWDRFERQNTLQQVVALGAPTLAVRSLSMALAGTDFFHHRHFADAAEQYRRTLIRTMNEDLMAHGRPGVGYDWQYAAGAGLWNAVEAFHYEPPTVGAVLVRQRHAIAALAIWFAIASGLVSTTARWATPV